MRHFSSMHAWLDEHSLSVRHSGDGVVGSLKQFTNGSPTNPAGHRQTARLFWTEHSAVGAHGLASTHGFVSLCGAVNGFSLLEVWNARDRSKEIIFTIQKIKKNWNCGLWVRKFLCTKITKILSENVRPVKRMNEKLKNYMKSKLQFDEQKLHCLPNRQATSASPI